MCRRAGLVLIVATCAAPVVAGCRVSAQATEEELVRRIESLLPRIEVARRAEEEALLRRGAEEAARNAASVEELRVGPLRILAFPEQARLAEELFAEVWQESFSLAEQSQELARHIFLFEWRTGRLRIVPAVVGPDEIATSVFHRVALTRAWVPTRG